MNPAERGNPRVERPYTCQYGRTMAPSEQLAARCGERDPEKPKECPDRTPVGGLEAEHGTYERHGQMWTINGADRSLRRLWRTRDRQLDRNQFIANAPNLGRGDVANVRSDPEDPALANLERFDRARRSVSNVGYVADDRSRTVHDVQLLEILESDCRSAAAERGRRLALDGDRVGPNALQVRERKNPFPILAAYEEISEHPCGAIEGKVADLANLRAVRHADDGLAFEVRKIHEPLTDEGTARLRSPSLRANLS